ncbi:MAG: hypothetical protein AUK55_09950 [Syntrophobacteraceae bacterium CG2_30_61_12]|nr:MAG: hypothetical protein AUK55_09950 [Syntrophobacteraceae bacterium CG2_30_61_12]PIU30967.1 MAG: hypothetical protein COT06_10705 [Syntrophobacteraceae bacterium CG07_land_8_20_14_0_80_61_8]
MPDRVRLSAEERRLVLEAAADFRRLQDWNYPRGRALDWVGDRYQLPGWQRELLNRGVFARARALRRRGKRVLGAAWCRRPLDVDGHNVHITVESVLGGRPWLVANDGAARDIAGQGAGFKMTALTTTAITVVAEFLRCFPPPSIRLFFDAPISRGGELAACYRRRLEPLIASVEAAAVAVPEHHFDYRGAVIAGSDRVVLDAAQVWLDLARRAVGRIMGAQPTIDFSGV